MTIGKKLYVNFGIILTMVVVLFIVNLLAVHREHDAKDAASASLKLADATNDVRFQMMQKPPIPEQLPAQRRQPEVDRMNDGLRTLSDRLQQGGKLANSEQERTALDRVQQLEESWSKEFAHPLIDKRKDVDSGNADRGGIADLLLTERRFFVGEEFDRRAGCGRQRKPASWSKRDASRMNGRALGRSWRPSSAL